MAVAVELDAVDLRILVGLQKDPRVTNQALAESVGVAPSTCLERTQRLRRNGVITGFAVRVDPAAVGRPVEAFLSVRVHPHRRSLVEPFVEHVLALPETRAVYHLTGPTDYLVHVTVQSVRDLQRLVLDEFTARDEVGLVQTNLIFEQWTGGPLLPPDK